MRKSKKHCQRIHAKKRLSDRYDVSINRHQMRDLTKRISSNTFIFKQSHRVTLHLIPHEGKLLFAVYDKQRKTIVTFLPLDANITKRHPEIVTRLKKVHRAAGIEFPIAETKILAENFSNDESAEKVD